MKREKQKDIQKKGENYIKNKKELQLRYRPRHAEMSTEEQNRKGEGEVKEGEIITDSYRKSFNLTLLLWLREEN